jgi:DNA-3-methyladenine glycosylase I
MAKHRCNWAGTDPEMIQYHDEVWGVPVHDDQLLFEFLTLEGAQAGLSWSTILKRRDGYRNAFAGFDVEKVARFGKRDVNRLLKDTGIIRNRLKVESTISNAKAFIEVQEEFGSFDAYIWKFVDGTPKQNVRKTMKDLPAETEESQQMSKELKKRGFRFVGPTICYAHMQATGMVNDHVTDCFRFKTVKKMK